MRHEIIRRAINVLIWIVAIVAVFYFLALTGMLMGSHP